SDDHGHLGLGSGHATTTGGVGRPSEPAHRQARPAGPRTSPGERRTPRGRDRLPRIVTGLADTRRRTVAACHGGNPTRGNARSTRQTPRRGAARPERIAGTRTV